MKFDPDMSHPDKNTVTTIMRAVEDAEGELSQIRSSMKRYAANPRKYKPQLDNVLSSARGLKHAHRRIEGMLGNIK